MKRILLLPSSLLLLLWLFIPTTDVVSPQWTVLVTDTSGNPIAGAEVTVFSQQYTVETQDVETTKTTGKDGLVRFDERKIHPIGLMRLVGTIRNLDQGAHASFGVHTHLHAGKSGYGDPSTLQLFAQNERESGQNGFAAQSSHIILQACPLGYSGFGCSFPDDPTKPILPLKLK